MRQRILILDRPSSARGDLAERLTVAGHDVVAVTESVEEAHRLVSTTAPDVGLVGGRWLVDAATPEPPGEVLPLAIVVVDGPTESSSLSGVDVSRAVPLSSPFTDRELALAMELARSTHQLARVESELESFFAVSVDHFCFLGFDGRFRRLNPAWERTLGYTREELMSRPFIEFVHPDDRERTLAQNAVVRSGGHAILFENRYVCKDGSYRWFLWNATPHVGKRVIYSAARDITERKNAEAERERLATELAVSEAEVRHLQEILPICSYCRKIRDDGDYWHEVEEYIARHTSSRFSHSICPDCMAREVEPMLAKESEGKRGRRSHPEEGG